MKIKKKTVEKHPNKQQIRVIKKIVGKIQNPKG